MKKTVLCHGVFDVLHAGHLAYFKAAKAFGDHLVVSVTTDRFVNKGPGRPYFSTQQRMAMVQSLSVVDQVMESDSPTAISVIESLKPHFYVKGPDYKNPQNDVTGEIVNEKAAVEAHGGKLVFTDEPTYSSGTLINRFLAEWTDDQKKTIEMVQSLGGIGAIRKAIEEIGKLKVLVIGEPILDIYRFVYPEGISSKSPSISARFQREETYLGGSMAIRQHLLDFAQSSELQSWNNPAVKKVRYISGSQRIFEVTDIQDQYWDEFDPTFFCDKTLELAEKADLVIAADFGHGMFEGEVLAMMEKIKTFVALNVQTNSSNFGFNVFTKHNRFDYLCLDTREVRLAFNNRHANPVHLALRISDKRRNAVTVTLGPNGSTLINNDQQFHSPAFADNIVDATGSGDALFAITSCLLKTGCQPELIPFIGNVFAGLKAKIIGNKSAVSKASLLKACEGILK